MGCIVIHLSEADPSGGSHSHLGEAMACSGCQQRRQSLAAAVKAVAAGDIRTATAQVSDVTRTLREDAGTVVRNVQRRAAAHARLKR